jgi:hypothetical protein
MTTGPAVTALSTAISLAFMAYGCRLYRNLTVDWFRQRMFALRDELFDLAAAGEIEFTHPAYTSLRTTMNGFIRFAHRMSLLNVILSAGVWHKADEKTVERNSFQVRWSKDAEPLPAPLRGKLTEKMLRMHGLVAAFLLLGTPLAGVMTALTIPAVVGVILRDWFQRLLRRLPPKVFDPIDATAFTQGASQTLAAAA